MSLTLIIGVAIVVILLASYAIAKYESNQPDKRANLWSIVIDTLGNPAKMLVLGTSTLLLIASLAISVEMGISQYDRMSLVGWIDVPKNMIIILQLVGTVATILAPVMAMMMLDTTAMKRANFDENLAKNYDFRQPGLVTMAVTFAIVIGTVVLGYLGWIEIASAMSMSFLAVCLGIGTALVVYCYNKTGATWEEIAGFTVTSLFAAFVYAIDFYWNRRLTIEIPMTQLTEEILNNDRALINAINAMHDAFMNRTLMTSVMIGMDILTSVLGLLSGEIPWIMKIMRYRAWQAVNTAVVEIDAKTSVAVENHTRAAANNTNNNTNRHNTGNNRDNVTPVNTNNTNNNTSGGSTPDPLDEETL